MSHILLINDMPSFGKVALAAMQPVLGYQGHHVYSLPTGLVSNTLDYGKFEILETTEYMQNTLAVWQQLGFAFDCICTGFILSLKQSEWIAEMMAHSSAFKMVDPIMGDDGRLYNGVGPENIAATKKLCQQADLIVPNFTEATYLTGMYIGQKEVTQAELEQLLQALRRDHQQAVVITSVFLREQNQHCVAGIAAEEERLFILEYEYLPVRVPGTGDLFSSVLLGCLLNHRPLKEAVQSAMDFVYTVIASHPRLEDAYRGVIVERFLSLLPEANHE